MACGEALRISLDELASLPPQPLPIVLNGAPNPPPPPVQPAPPGDDDEDRPYFKPKIHDMAIITAEMCIADPNKYKEVKPICDFMVCRLNCRQANEATQAAVNIAVSAVAQAISYLMGSEAQLDPTAIGQEVSEVSAYCRPVEIEQHTYTSSCGRKPTPMRGIVGVFETTPTATLWSPSTWKAFSPLEQYLSNCPVVPGRLSTFLAIQASRSNSFGSRWSSQDIRLTFRDPRSRGLICEASLVAMAKTHGEIGNWHANPKWYQCPTIEL